MYQITVLSQNKKSIKNFFTFLKNTNININLFIIKKRFQKKNKKKIITILKSPHVNKTAQEQFELKFFSKQFLIKPKNKNLQFITSIKKIKAHLFPDLKILIKFNSNFKTRKKSYKIFNFNNLITKQQVILVKNALNFIDVFGELLIK